MRCVSCVIWKQFAVFPRQSPGFYPPIRSIRYRATCNWPRSTCRQSGNYKVRDYLKVFWILMLATQLWESWEILRTDSGSNGIKAIRSCDIWSLPNLLASYYVLIYDITESYDLSLTKQTKYIITYANTTISVKWIHLWYPFHLDFIYIQWFNSHFLSHFDSFPISDC